MSTTREREGKRGAIARRGRDAGGDSGMRRRGERRAQEQVGDLLA